MIEMYSPLYYLIMACSITAGIFVIYLVSLLGDSEMRNEESKKVKT